MRTISLDESGSFEKEFPDAGLSGRVIGGIELLTKDASERDAEAQRVLRMLKNICAEAGGEFPQDLHRSNYADNAIVVANVNELFRERAADFMQGRGDFADDPPHGVYRLYAVVHTENGLNLPATSNLVDPGVASNLYEGMAYHAIENMLFYDRDHFDRECSLYLATRTPPLDFGAASNAGQNVQAYRQMGHVTNRSANAAREYLQVTTASSYRAVLAQMILRNSWNKDLHIENLCVCPIHYKNDRNLTEQAFLYLADLICGWYRIVMKQHGSGNGEGLTALKENAAGLTGAADNSFWAYDDVDVAYRHAFAACQGGDFFTCLEYLYKAQQCKTSSRKYYKDNWLPVIRRQLQAELTPQTLKYAFERLRADLQSADFSLPKCSFIFDELKSLMDGCQQADAETFYLCYTIEITIENHYGRYENAQKAFESAKPYVSGMSAEEYLELRNIYAVSLCDSGQAQAALDFTKQTIEYEKQLVRLRSAIIPNAEPASVHEGRSESQLGQCYAFCCQWQEANACFERALEHFGTARIDRQRTLSYYLHALIEQPGERELYEKYAAEYFGVSDYREQFKALADISDDTSRRFAIYVYIKALFVFYRKQASADFLKEVLAWLDSSACAAPAERKQHPWEIIYKYCALLALLCRDEKSAKAYQKEAKKKLGDNEALLRNIVKNGEQEIERYKNDGECFSAKDKYTYMYR